METTSETSGSLVVYPGSGNNDIKKQLCEYNGDNNNNDRNKQNNKNTATSNEIILIRMTISLSAN